MNRDRYPQLRFFQAGFLVLQYIDKVVDVLGDAVALWSFVKEFHIFSTCCSRCSLGMWTLFPRAPCSGSHLPLCVATVHGGFWANFFQFLREKWTRISLQFTLGNLELFLRAVSGSHRVRQSTLHIFIVLVVPASLRSSHLKILTLFLHAVIWRWDGDFGGFDAFFALLRVVPELSARFGSPRWRRVLCHRGLPLPISMELC